MKIEAGDPRVRHDRDGFCDFDRGTRFAKLLNDQPGVTDHRDP